MGVEDGREIGKKAQPQEVTSLGEQAADPLLPKGRRGRPLKYTDEERKAERRRRAYTYYHSARGQERYKQNQKSRKEARLQGGIFVQVGRPEGSKDKQLRARGGGRPKGSKDKQPRASRSGRTK